MKKVADGFTILKKYGPIKNACWILEHNGEAAIVETPPYKKGEKPPYQKAKIYCKKNKLFPKYVLLTHPHWDHCQTLPEFRVEFPQAQFIAHESFLRDHFFRYMIRNTRTRRGKSWLDEGKRFFDDVYFNDVYRCELGGEPLYLIHAPKHSYGDQMIVFRGAMITGDWYIGDLTDCNDLVDPGDKVNSINRLMQVISQLNYHVHMLFSGHGDSLMFDADFYSIMEASKVAHNGNQPDLKCRYVRN